MRNGDRTPLQYRLDGGAQEVGRLTQCYSCHIPRSGTGYLFGVSASDRAGALLVLAAGLSGPIFWNHHLVLALPALAFVIRLAPNHTEHPLWGSRRCNRHGSIP